MGDGGIRERLQKLDAHSTVSNEFRVRTSYGAFLSTITIVAIFYLVRSELKYNFEPETISTVHVKPTSPKGLNVDFDISFSYIPCALLSIDADDPTGQAQSLHLDRTHRVFKHRLDKDGKRIGRRSRFEMGGTMKDESDLEELFMEMNAGKDSEGGGDDEVRDEEACGSCYGAGEDDECCNTCDDVKRAYNRKGWHVEDMKLIKQCQHVKSSKEENGEGCRVSGNVALGTGGGNFHFVPSKSLENFGHESELTLADYLATAFETYNVTHTIHRLHFGQAMPGQKYQLDGEERTIIDNHGMYQYYLQIVPSNYKSKNKIIHTNQFAVTEHLRHLSPGSNRGLPGVYFFYEVTPLHVEQEETVRGWTRFFTSVCAVVGGLYTFMGMVDKIIFDATKGRVASLKF